MRNLSTDTGQKVPPRPRKWGQKWGHVRGVPTLGQLLDAALSVGGRS